MTDIYDSLRTALGNEGYYPDPRKFCPSSEEVAIAHAKGAGLPDGFRFDRSYEHYPLGAPKKLHELRPMKEDASEDEIGCAKARWRQSLDEWREFVSVYTKTYSDLSVRVEITICEHYHGGYSTLTVFAAGELGYEPADDGSFKIFRAPSVTFPGYDDLESFEKETLPAVVKLMQDHRLKSL